MTLHNPQEVLPAIETMIAIASLVTFVLAYAIHGKFSIIPKSFVETLCFAGAACASVWFALCLAARFTPVDVLARLV